MLKKVILVSVIFSVLLCAVSCKTDVADGNTGANDSKKATKELTCDGCGKTVEVDADSNMTDEWILFCSECGEPEISFDE